MLNNLRKSIAKFIAPALNSMSLPREFLKYGNRIMRPDWSYPEMKDWEFYTGYAYAAIRKRSNGLSRLASENTHTESIVKIKEGQPEFVHPYYQLIWDASTFSEYQFWCDISTYLDLKGVYYLMAVRAVSGEGRVGAVQQFKLLNPYNIQRILTSDDLQVRYYVEHRNGMQRIIPKEMIIEIRELNPFHEWNPYSMTEAAKESQFTLKTSGDYTRHALRNNINAPGILSTDMILPPEKFENLKSRVREHVKGEPIFVNGAGGLDWKEMNQDLTKSSLKDVSEVNRDVLFSVADVSKTLMNIEQSGVTRDTAKVQKDLHVEYFTLPRAQMILDALNLDYRNYYPAEYAKNQAYMWIDNPNATDHDATIKQVTVRKDNFTLYDTLISKGYEPEVAAQYVEGEIDVDKLGEPTRPPTQQAAVTPTIEEEAVNHHGHVHNALLADNQNIVDGQQNMLQNAVVNVEEQIVADAMNRVTKMVKNDFDYESDLFKEREKRGYINELTAVLSGFYLIIFQMNGDQTMQTREGEFELPGSFSLSKSIRNYVKALSEKVATSHVNTVTNDVFTVVREAALQGKSQAEIVSLIKERYSKDIVTTRAKTIARTETNRAFTRSQFEADKQFIAENKLGKRAYKRWKTRSNNPCGFCQALEAEGLIPFNQDFRGLGESVTITKDGKEEKLEINFESLEAGNAHPNCACIFELVILKE